MRKKIILNKATRIEGSANIHIEIENNEVKAAHFKVEDFRGFEKFMQGRSVEHTPHLISRICGLCSTSHQVASLKAIEDALAINVNDSVKNLREIIILAEWISSHALSYFFLTMPDFVGATGGVFDLMQSHREIAEDALALRHTGQDIVKILGKRAVHPVSLGIGGFSITPDHEDLDRVEKLAAEAKERTGRLIDQISSASLKQAKIKLPEAQKIHFLTYDSISVQGMFNVYNTSGEVIHRFNHDEFEENIAEMHAEWTFAKTPYLKRYGFPQGIVLVGPLSRSFSKGGILSDPEISNFELLKETVHNKPLSLENYDVYRLLEIYWAAKRITELMQDVKADELQTIPFENTSGKGIGVIEAPRGVLVHSYMINRGCIEKLRLYVATQFNYAYINMLIKDIAEKHVEGNNISTEGEHLIGRSIRIFDPCLSCATH